MGYRYSWQEGSAIGQIDVRVNAAGWQQIIIYAPENVTDNLLSLPAYLEKNKVTAYLDEVDGRSVIKVADIEKKDGEFLTLLQKGGFVSGTPNKVEIPDEVPKLGLLGTIRKYSLNVSGLLGELGHAALITQAMFKNEKGERNTKNIATGTFYAISTALPSAFGSGAGAIRFSKITNDLRGYLAKEGFTLSDSLIATPQIKFRDRGILTRFWDSIKSHPVQTQNMISLPGNILLTLSGREESKKTGGASGAGYVISGILAAIGAVIAIVVPEATPERLEELKNRKGFRQTLKDEGLWPAIKTIPDGMYAALSKKPLAFYGGLLATENVFGIDRQFLQVMNRYKEGQNDPTKKIGLHDPVLTGVQAFGWTLSSLTGTLGSKKRDKSLETKQAYDGLYAQTANLIIGVPDKLQDLAIHKASEFLAAQPDVHVRAAEIQDELIDKIKILRTNPWTSTVINLEKKANKDNSAQAEVNQLEEYASNPVSAASRNNLAAESPASMKASSKVPPAPKSFVDALAAEAVMEQHNTRS